MKKIYPAFIIGFIALLLVSVKIKAHTLIHTLNAQTLFISDTLKAEHPVKKSSYQIGVQIENTIRTGYSNEVNYEYKPVLIQLEFQKVLIKRGKRGWTFDYFIQPQFNMVRFSENGRSNGNGIYKSWEAGVNAGIIVLRPLIDISGAGEIDFYALGSLGPHYIGLSPSRQAKGFLFSDNLRIGLRIPLTSSLIFDLRTGIRHLSNASLKAPNGGLDDIMFGAGIRMVIEQ